MLIFENAGEIDPQLITLIGVNIKTSPSAIGYFGTGLKYAIACLSRWEDEIVIQSGTAIFTFTKVTAEIRGKTFGVIKMLSHVDSLQLGFTTELGKNWEPWMVYRELWCNAHDEPEAAVYEAETAPAPRIGYTRVIVNSPKLNAAHGVRDTFILAKREPLHKLEELEIYFGESSVIFYRGIAVQQLDKPSLYTYNITSLMYLTEDRTASSYSTGPIIARGLAALKDKSIVSATILAPPEAHEAQLDYGYVYTRSVEWDEVAKDATLTTPLRTPASVRAKFPAPAAPAEEKPCPTCGQLMPPPADDENPF
jgi:hypothetical protein